MILMILCNLVNIFFDGIDWLSSESCSIVEVDNGAKFLRLLNSSSTEIMFLP